MGISSVGEPCMKASTAIATFRRLRTQPLWRLLASDHGPLTLGLLQTHLYESERGLPASIFHAICQA
ncbi:DUF3375 family protein [Pseudomonas sp. 3JA]|uniref:DUF3375 family protein n=1 Tax=Pseudomonas sp. 3JA TaxID=3109347 RepID=UPI003008927C